MVAFKHPNAYMSGWENIQPINQTNKAGAVLSSALEASSDDEGVKQWQPISVPGTQNSKAAIRTRILVFGE